MMETFVVDVDGTLCESLAEGQLYASATPKQDVIDKVNELFYNGHNIILLSSRGMRTYGGDLVFIEKNVRPIMEAWLLKHGVQYHQLVLGKPWGPRKVHYIDDHAMYINDFLEYTPSD